MVEISPTAKISSLADIEDSKIGTKIIISEGVFIDSFVKIKCIGGIGDIVIGKNSFINSGTVIYSGNGISIGEDVLIAANCTFAPVNHAYKQRNVKISKQRFAVSKGGIVVEDDVWIGANTVLLDGAILKKGCVVGAHSLVRGTLEKYSINFGVPTKKVAMRK